LLFSFFALAFQVSELSSVSMSPTLLPGDWVLVNRLIYRLRPPRRGDIILFHFPQAGGRDFVKRVIGVPGDVVKEQAGRFTVNAWQCMYRGRSSDPRRPWCSAWAGVPADQLYMQRDSRDQLG
jgi:signal peptidase I